MLDVPVIEQVIAVPKISLERVPQRSALPVPQTAEQLVEVPTEPVYVAVVLASKVYSRREIRRVLSGLGSTASGSRVDSPVPQGRGGGGARGGLQGSRSGQNLSAHLEQIVEIPVPQGRGGGRTRVVAWVSCWRRFPTVQTVQKTGEIPQVLFLRPLLYNDRCLGYDSTENYGISAVAVLTRWSMSLFVQFIGGMDVAVIIQLRRSVHRQSSWTFQYAQRQGAFSEGLVAM